MSWDIKWTVSGTSTIFRTFFESIKVEIFVFSFSGQKIAHYYYLICHVIFWNLKKNFRYHVKVFKLICSRHILLNKHLLWYIKNKIFPHKIPLWHYINKLIIQKNYVIFYYIIKEYFKILKSVTIELLKHLNWDFLLRLNI